MADVFRTTASFRERDIANLELIAEEAGLTRNDAIRKALATEAFIQKQMQRKGRILIEDEDGTQREVAWI